MLRLLGLDFTLVDVDLKKREQKTDAFLRMNPLGQVPVLEDGGECIPDSNAILVYLGLKYDLDARYFPRSALDQAEVQRWLSIAAGQLSAGPARLRLARVFGTTIDEAAAQQISVGLFSVLETELSDREFLLKRGVTVADVALYTYLAHAPEGGFSLEPYPNVLAWIRRVEALPGFVGMTKTPLAT